MSIEDANRNAYLRLQLVWHFFIAESRKVVFGRKHPEFSSVPYLVSDYSKYPSEPRYCTPLS